MRRDQDKSGGFHEAALEQLDGLYAFAMTLTRDPTAAEDLVQETYLRATLAYRRPPAGNNLKAWLFIIMRNLWHNEARHRRSGPEFIGLDTKEGLGLSDADDDPQVVHLRLSDLEAVRAVIVDLPAAYREVVVLREIEGFSYREIAEILACPVGTVMSRLARGRNRLKQRLADRYKEPEQNANLSLSKKV
jgi:RNA polymerase sigma-70 factor, ECF subfamily